MRRGEGVKRGRKKRESTEKEEKYTWRVGFFSHLAGLLKMRDEREEDREGRKGGKERREKIGRK